MGRIGSGTRSQLWCGLISTREGTSTMFWVPSVVPVGSVVTMRDARPGLERTTARLITPAQWATLASVSLIVRGYSAAEPEPPRAGGASARSATTNAANAPASAIEVRSVGRFSEADLCINVPPVSGQALGRPPKAAPVQLR